MKKRRQAKKTGTTKHSVAGLVILLIALMLAACGTQQPPAAPPNGGAESAADDPATESSQQNEQKADTESLTSVKVGLDWTPNTNHTGLYVAQQKDYYRDNGLEVEIVQAQEGGTVEQLVATGRLAFGVSYQEFVTQARAEQVPVVSIAAIIQHNTSGFASRAEENITSASDFAGKKYGAFGSPIEDAVISGLMECEGADFEQVEFVNIGSSDFFVATERGDVDFAWVFQGWTGIEADIRGVDLNMLMINDMDCLPDYYSPVLITSEQMIAEQPEIVRSFVQASSQGYQFAIEQPEEAATILLDAVPELDEELVDASQTYLATQYQADAPHWGEQQMEVWQEYAKWMNERDLIPQMISPAEAFTNEFLPHKK